MNLLERLSRAALKRDSLALRAYALELLAAYPNLESVPPPAFQDAELLAVAASLVELFAERGGQNPPAWAARVGRSARPFFLLLASAERMPRLRLLCETESPEPLRKRGFYAPANFLEFA